MDDGEIIFDIKDIPNIYDDIEAIDAITVARDALVANLLPASCNQITEILAKLSIHCAFSNRPECEFRVLIRDYQEDLSHTPVDILTEVCIGYRRGEYGDNRFFPRVSQLRDWAYPKIWRRKMELKRLNDILAKKSIKIEYAKSAPITDEMWRALIDDIAMVGGGST